MNTLTVMFVDTLRTQMSIVHENSFLPYKKRIVHVPLTEEQIKLLEPRVTGKWSGVDQFEEIGDTFLEDK